jgi:hypothetical protein
MNLKVAVFEISPADQRENPLANEKKEVYQNKTIIFQ